MPAHASAHGHLFLVAANADFIPVFEPLVELAYAARVTDKISKAFRFVPICPHIAFGRLALLSRRLYSSIFWEFSLRQLFSELEVGVVELISHELFEASFIDDFRALGFSIAILATLGHFTAVFEFISSNQVVGLSRY